MIVVADKNGTQSALRYAINSLRPVEAVLISTWAHCPAAQAETLLRSLVELVVITAMTHVFVTFKSRASRQLPTIDEAPSPFSSLLLNRVSRYHYCSCFLVCTTFGAGSNICIDMFARQSPSGGRVRRTMYVGCRGLKSPLSPGAGRDRGVQGLRMSCRPGACLPFCWFPRDFDPRQRMRHFLSLLSSSTTILVANSCKTVGRRSLETGVLSLQQAVPCDEEQYHLQ